jgi:EAL domain-containing protein (putative c-di-GMP-specific phosphodiesterase class I)
VAAEALVRWNHPRHGLLAPSTFVPAAEQTGTITGIDRAVLEQACREAALWAPEDGYAPDAAVHVNLSGEGLRTSELVGVVEDVLRRTGLAPRRLVLELTESVLIAEMPTAQPMLTALRAIGVRIALDDFGTGYSSLACLRSLSARTSLKRAPISTATWARASTWAGHWTARRGGSRAATRWPPRRSFTGGSGRALRPRSTPPAGCRRG